jgi:hypothetical protein
MAAFLQGGGLGFSANGYVVTRITNVGSIAPKAVVVAENTAFYWGKGGIYMLSADKVTGTLQPQNISQTTIQTYYNEIDSVVKEQAQGTYDPRSQKIEWMYQDAIDESYCNALVLDTTLGAFYKERTEATTPYLCGYVRTNDFVTTGSTEDVVIDGEIVQVNVDDDVYVDTIERTSSESSTKYLTLNTDGQFTFSLHSGTDFLDWGVTDYSSYLVTGYELFGDSIRDKSVPYLFVHCEITEDGYDETGAYTNPSSCTVQAQWEWTNSANSNRWGAAYEAYRLQRHYIPANANDDFGYGFSVMTSKNKLRGRGKALSIKFSSATGKDCKLLGWAVGAVGATVP